MYTLINHSSLEQKWERIIIKTFNNWAIYSKSKSFPKMSSLVLPKSDFHSLSYACKKSSETGISYGYEFERLEIVNFSNNKTVATIRGIIILIMACADNNYKGKFLSTCYKGEATMDWKLKDIEIEWL